MYCSYLSVTIYCSYLSTAFPARNKMTVGTATISCLRLTWF